MSSCSFLDLPYELRIMIYEYSGMLRKPPDYCHCYCKACQSSEEHREHHYKTGLIRPIIKQPSVLVNSEEDVFNTWIARSNTYNRAQPKYVHTFDSRHWRESSDLHRQVKEHHKYLYDTYGGSEENRARPLPRLAAEPDLALVSHHIRAETLEIFYSKQTFNFLIMKLPDDVDNLQRWLSALGSRALWLRRLVLVYKKKNLCKKHRKYLLEHLLGQGVRLRSDALTFRRPAYGKLCCQSNGEIAYESETYRCPGQW